MFSQRFKNEMSFVIGVANVAGTAWLMGAYPWCMWIYHSIKIFLVLAERVYAFGAKKKEYFLLDYCYTINYWSILYYIICVSKAVPEESANVLGPIFFRIGFTAATGPLAMSILAFRNSLVFHSLDQTGILAVHWSPSMALWGMRWFPAQLENAFPNTFHIGCTESDEYTLFYDSQNCPGTFVDLWCWPVVHYIVLWSIPYALFVFVIGKGYLEEGGYHTVYSEMKDKSPMKDLIAKIPFGAPELKYMMIHGTAVCFAFFLGVLFWHSFILHTMYLLVLFTVMTRNGASYYFMVFPKLLAKEKAEAEALKKAAEEKDGVEAGENTDALLGSGEDTNKKTEKEEAVSRP